MALLRHSRTERIVLVEPELIIGRSPNCGLQVQEPYVSAQHATLRWGGARWELKDLGSRNGTFLNGARLEVGKAYAVVEGASLAFGSEAELWLMQDASAPEPMAIPLDGGEPITPENDVIGLPTSDSPQASIFRDVDGLWKLETLEGDRVVLDSHKPFQVAGRPWRFASPEALGPSSSTLMASSDTPVSLRFTVSRDEEHVELCAIHGDLVVDLGSRQHNYLLLTLARARREDEKSGFPETTCGWIHQEDLLSLLHITSTQLNIDVFRIRQHFARVGLPGVANVIERRPRSKQLRLGFSSFEINVV
ncbi:MAG: FHA domain-containing protein [Myxococcota bacterium]